MSEATLFSLSGPSGVGKGTIVSEVLKEDPGIHLSVSATTRSPRKGEVPGVSYYFMEDAQFRSEIRAGGFLEYADVHGHFYGTPKVPVMEKLAEGKDVILEIDVQGAMKVRETYPDGVFIFILPPSLHELRRRIEERGTESREDIELRLGKAVSEMNYLDRYEYYVVNEDLQGAVADVRAIMRAERCRVRKAEDILKKIEEES